MLKKVLLTTTFMLMATSAHAACKYDNKVPISVISYAFPAFEAITKAMAECPNVTVELTQDLPVKQPPAFAANPALYQVGGEDNNTFNALYEAGVLRPLDDLVEKYGKHLKPNQLIKFDGKIYSIGAFINTQHLMYRKDILDELKIPVPQNWDQMLEAAEKIKESGKVPYPLGVTWKQGFHIGQDFVNMYAGFGGKFFNDDGTPAINSPEGLKTLEMMKRMQPYVDPEYLVADTTYVQQQFQQEKVALSNLWASRAANMDDEKESKVVGKVGFAAAPRAMEGGAPATTLLWYGMVIAKNATDEQADAAFQVILEGLDKEMVEANNDKAAWIVDGYKPGKYASGVSDTAAATPPPILYPASGRMSQLHSALGEELPTFLKGDRDAQATLDAVDAKYNTMAKEAGLIK